MILQVCKNKIPYTTNEFVTTYIKGNEWPCCGLRAEGIKIKDKNEQPQNAVRIDNFAISRSLTDSMATLMIYFLIRTYRY